MTESPNDALLKEIDGLLTIEPSPEFAAKVRARIEGGRRQRGWHLLWASIAMVVLVGGLRMLPRSLAVTPTTPAARVGLAQPQTISIGKSGLTNIVRAPERRSAIAESRNARATDTSHVDVITNQPALLKMLWAAVTVPVETGSELPKPLQIDITPIAVTTLPEIPRLTVTPIVLGSVDDFRDKE